MIKALKQVMRNRKAASRIGQPVAADLELDASLRALDGWAVPTVPIQEMHRRLNWAQAVEYPASSLKKPLSHWKMELDDSPLFRYIYRNCRPQRHLEFGTWEGTGVVYCLEESAATVWTLNPAEGETEPDGGQVYANDSLGFIGRHYINRGLGHRVCQIYCDSRDWDVSNYPSGFFDTALIDGGHSEEVVANDTQKACRLVRPGGIVMWHDFCPQAQVLRDCTSPRGVILAVHHQWEWLSKQMQDLFWISPSWILIGVNGPTG